MPEDPFKQFKYVPTIAEILETAIGRANKQAGKIATRKGQMQVQRVKSKEIRKIEVAFDYVTNYFHNIVTSVPNFSLLPRFYVELAQILVNTDDLKQKLGRISGTARVLDNIKHEQIRKMVVMNKVQQVRDCRKEAFGRLKSVIDRLEKDFTYLRESRKVLKSLPVIHESLPAVVFAGYPNVGKSSSINNICGSKIKVAYYPFTTKEIKIGLYKGSPFKVQFIDTPGVLDRPMSKRNAIEKQAILAIKIVSDLIIFMIDPSFNSGFTMERQLELLREIEYNFSSVDTLVVINKIDAIEPQDLEKAKVQIQAATSKPILLYSALTRENEEEFLDSIIARLSEMNGEVTRWN
ncbi:MAG: NOG1 family protein [Promethearchaeota archaeon]